MPFTTSSFKIEKVVISKSMVESLGVLPNSKNVPKYDILVCSRLPNSHTSVKINTQINLDSYKQKISILKILAEKSKLTPLLYLKY
jgi:Sec7-like guanine-nucleotide exchange factor